MNNRSENVLKILRDVLTVISENDCHGMKTVGGTKINNQEITKTRHKNDHSFSTGTEYGIYKKLPMGLNYYIGLKNNTLSDSQNEFGITNTNHVDFGCD